MNVNDRTRSTAQYFFGGTLISSVGNFAFTLGAMSFMVKADYSLSQVGLWVGSSRMMTVVATLFFGGISDRAEPIKFLVITESLAFVISLALLSSWSKGPSWFPIFFSLSMARSLIIPLQSGTRSKISKLLSGNEFLHNLKTAILLNKTTQGGY